MDSLNQLLVAHKKQKKELQEKLLEFRFLPEQNYFSELIFCILTPQSNGKRCWEAAREVVQLSNPSPHHVRNILVSKVRFHNTKTSRVITAFRNWSQIKELLSEPNIPLLRSSLAKAVSGFGMKESSHFVRNIGKSNNKIAILDRHILRNLQRLGVIHTTVIKNPGHYLELEQQFLRFAQKIKVPVDELDLLFWARETGEVFK